MGVSTKVSVTKKGYGVSHLSQGPLTGPPGDYQREAAEKDREYDSTASALEGKRELNAEETARLKHLWKKLVRMFHPDLHEHDPEKRKTYELLTQGSTRALACGFQRPR